MVYEKMQKSHHKVTSLTPPFPFGGFESSQIIRGRHDSCPGTGFIFLSHRLFSPASFYLVHAGLADLLTLGSHLHKALSFKDEQFWCSWWKDCWGIWKYGDKETIRLSQNWLQTDTPSSDLPGCCKQKTEEAFKSENRENQSFWGKSL